MISPPSTHWHVPTVTPTVKMVKMVTTGGADDTAKRWDIATDDELLTLDHGDDVNTVAISCAVGRDWSVKG